MGATLLHYRPWQGEFRQAHTCVWPIARVGLRMVFRYWPFWVIYSLGLMIFCLFFFGQYLLAWAETQVDEPDVRVGGFIKHANPRFLVQWLRVILKLNGSGETYRTFIYYQSYIVLVVLALAGSMLIGNDLRHGSTTFYLSKPISRWHYVLGKCLAAAVLINMITTLPAVVLFVQYGLLDSWAYFLDNGRLFWGILGYGLVLTLTFSLLLVAIATWVKRTVPMIMTWVTVFLFPRFVAGNLVGMLGFDPRFRLIDLWNDAYLLGNWCLGIDRKRLLRSPTQPSFLDAALVLAALWIFCLVFLVRRVRAVEIVR